MAESTGKKVRIPIDMLAVGWVCDHDLYAGYNLLLAKGTMIDQQILLLLKRRNITHIEISRSSELAAFLQEDEEEHDPFFDLLYSAAEVYLEHNVMSAVPEQVLKDAADHLHSFFTKFELGEHINANELRPVVNQLVAEFIARPEFAIKLLDLDFSDKYTYYHSINVSLLYMLVAQDWCENEDELGDLAFGAMLHDIGKAKVGSQILNKPTPLTDDEWAIVRKHPVWAAQLLADSDASLPVMSIAMSHHEHLDGSGYPYGLKGDDIDKYARLAGVCDMYDAATTSTFYRKKQNFALAIDDIIKACGTHFDSDIAHHFIQKIGLYPLGTFVRISTGEVAVVLRHNSHAFSRPVVSRVMDAQGNRIHHREEFDLSKEDGMYVTGVIVETDVLRG